jgi:outer membrane protein TolC
MRRQTRLLTSVASLLLAGGAGLGAGDGRLVARLSLSEVVERAVATSARLRALEQGRTGAEAQLRGARAGRLPTADLTAGYTRRSNIAELTIPSPEGPPRTLFPNLPDNVVTRLAVAVPVYTGGRVGAAIDAAREGRRAAESELETARQDLVLETHNAYWSLVTARRAEAVLREGLAAFEAHLTDAQNRERFGLAARNEVLAVQVEHDRAELRRLQAEQLAQLAEANLVRLLDLEPGTLIEPTQILDTAESGVASLAELTRLAYASRTERRQLEAALAAAEARVRIERAARRPQVAAVGGFDYSNPNRAILPPEDAWKHTWDVGVQVSMRLFDGGRTSAAVARAQAEAEAVKQQLSDLDQRIRLQVTQARLELETAVATVRVSEQGLEAARENHRVAEERYREGVIPSSELLDASVALLRAGLDRTQALAGVRIASAQLDRAVGR